MGHLSKEQQHTLKQKLETRRKDLREQIRTELLRADEERYTDLAGEVQDPGEESVADLLSDLNNSLIGNSIRELREVEAALQRFAEGSYGICDECGTEIPFPRLQAYPTASRCIEDQERFERLSREEPGRPSL